MPTYFFNTYDGAEFVDQTGTELSDDAQAHCEAVRLAGTMLRDDPHLLISSRVFRAEVVSEAGEPLFTVMASTVSGRSAKAA
jgi:hypothetical protein